LQEISYNEHINNDTTNFKINIFITRHQLSKLSGFSTSQGVAKASNKVQEITDILTYMFSHVDSFEPEEFADIIKKVIFSIVMDQEIQIAI